MHLFVVMYDYVFVMRIVLISGKGCINAFKINTYKPYTLKNKGASKGSSSDAIEEPFLVPQRTIQSKVL